jgi:hypothetical protein
MIEVKIEHEKPMSIMAIVTEMREHGYAQRKDFDFTFYPAIIENNILIPRHTIFTFYDEVISSWFLLKYVK